MDLRKGFLENFNISGTMQSRMLVYLILALVPMTLLALSLAVDERNEEEARARSEETAVVNTVKTDLDRLVQLTRGLVSSLSYQDSDSQICNSLSPLRRSFPELFNLSMLDVASGGDTARSVCSAFPPSTNPFPLTHEETRLIATLPQPGDTVVGAIRTNTVDGQPVTPIGSLVRIAPDGTRRLATVTVSVKALNEQVGLASLPAQATLLVLDRNGAIAAQNPPSPS